MKKLNLHQYVWYFFIYSILGMLLENVFCLLTSFKIESRKGFIIGPFCPIYGIGALLFTILLDKKKGNKLSVFLLGMIIGSTFEYLSSYFMQALYGVKFWDYTNQPFNLNGRTSIMYAICWGILSLALIYFLNPKINRFIKYFEYKSLDIVILTYMSINAILTYGAINQYVSRVEQKIEEKQVKSLSSHQKIMTNEVMQAIFPNMLYVTKTEKSIPIREILN